MQLADVSSEVQREPKLSHLDDLLLQAADVAPRPFRTSRERASHNLGWQQRTEYLKTKIICLIRRNMLMS